MILKHTALAEAQQLRNTAMDGVRGVAAIVVVLFHVDHFFPDFSAPPSGYLAVDMFFALSGYVIARAYGDRLLKDASVFRFFWLRFKRLYPSYLAGTALGVCLAAPALEKNGLGTLDLLAALTMAPDPFSPILYPLNPPAWSLFYEMTANLTFALLWRQCSRKSVLLIVGVATVMLPIAAISFGTLDAGHRWSALSVGFARVLFGFFVGVAIYSHNLKFGSFSPLAITLIALVILFVPVPHQYRLFFDIFMVVCIVPGIVMMCAGAELKQSPADRWLAGLGAMSYPLYTTHAPVLLGVRAVLAKLDVPPSLIVIGGALVLSFVVAQLTQRLVDTKTRRSHKFA